MSNSTDEPILELKAYILLRGAQARFMRDVASSTEKWCEWDAVARDYDEQLSLLEG